MQADLADLITAARMAERTELRYLAQPTADTMRIWKFHAAELARLADDFQEEHLQGSFY